MMTWDYPKLTEEEIIKQKSSFQLPQESLQKVVKYLSDGLLEAPYRKELQSFFEFQSFHDFQQGTMPPYIMRAIVKDATGIILDHPIQLDINIAHVSKNIDSKTHSHADAIAVAQVLGQRHGYDDPIGGEIYNGHEWIAPKVGEEFVFPENMRHGLKRTPEGKLTFLTVQSLAVNRKHLGLGIDYIETK